ncbi:retrovirus-related pol polyprotein from transposon TNT 1-94 [Tanacetum coccineum]
MHKYSKESGLKVVFRDDALGDTEGHGSVNCNGITFTRVAYVNGSKHKLISISQLCDANYKVLFTKSQGTIYIQNNEVVLIAPRRRDVYVIDMSSFNKESNACFFAKASLSINWLWHKRLSHLNFKNINNLAKHNLDHLGKFDEKSDDGFFLGYSLMAKAFRVFNIRRQEMEEIIHVTFSKDDEAISQSNTEGDAINFNENRSFPDDEFLDQGVKLLSALAILTLHAPDQTESTDHLEPVEPQNNVIIKPISDVQPSLTIPSSAEVILQTPIPQDRWSREKHIDATSCWYHNLLLVSQPLAGITTRSRIRDSDAASAFECLYVNFLSEIEPKKLIEALEEEG